MPALWWAVLLAAAAGKPVIPVRPRPAATILPDAGTVSLTASPSTISFNAANPNAPSVPGSSPATVTWWLSGHNQRAWTLSIQSSASSFSRCSSVSVSAVAVSCSSITVAGSSQPCSPPITLSATPQVIAQGNEGAGLAYYSVILNFTFTDSWSYIAELSPQCSLSLTYNGNFN